MSRIGEDRLRASNGLPKGRLSAPIRKALEIGAEQQCHPYKERLRTSAEMSERDADAFPDHVDVLYAPVVKHMIDNWCNDPDDLNAQVFLEFLHQLQDKDPAMLAELFSFVRLCCTGSVIEGWLAGMVYTDEKKAARRNARLVRPGR